MIGDRSVGGPPYGTYLKRLKPSDTATGRRRLLKGLHVAPFRSSRLVPVSFERSVGPLCLWHSASAALLAKRCRGARVERAHSVSTAIQLGDSSGKVLCTRRLESRGALALSSTAESVCPSDSRFVMATFLIYYLKTSRIVWLISVVL